MLVRMILLVFGTRPPRQAKEGFVRLLLKLVDHISKNALPKGHGALFLFRAR